MISHEDQKNLPTSFHKRELDGFPWLKLIIANETEAGVYKLCQIQANLEDVSENEFQLKNKRPWQGEAYYVAGFTLKAIVGPADLKFELWFKDKRYNRAHDPISIEWDSAGTSLRPPSRDSPADYWEMPVYKS